MRVVQDGLRACMRWKSEKVCLGASMVSGLSMDGSFLMCSGKPHAGGFRRRQGLLTRCSCTRPHGYVHGSSHGPLHAPVPTCVCACLHCTHCMQLLGHHIVLGRFTSQALTAAGGKALAGLREFDSLRTEM